MNDIQSYRILSLFDLSLNVECYCSLFEKSISVDNLNLVSN